ncbi:putative sporulation protein YtxC [Clostridium grantii]|uniref:Putative sporulation protein YtxC n=1 Tax=Clostridium grantii DSM 8605 TaxID=1121316 RepID=A0A1M5XJY7_9CLOT|nr:putative sporulation protein YtxC [Clostridium grantii]SHI00130.1 putative sporulation protein YtxC [Clostridium grantii DSM 8605]
MILLTIIYSNEKYDITDKLNKMQSYFSKREILLGFSESIKDNNHFIEIYGLNPTLSDKVKNNLQRYIASFIFKLFVGKFLEEEFGNLVEENYFFLKEDEIIKVREQFKNLLTSDKETYSNELISCINIKNKSIENVVGCLNDSEKFNIDGYYTFRKKSFKKEMEQILNILVEEHMVEKEYDEFIKLLKYFVDIQESKIELIKIIIEDNGEYLIKDKNEKDIMQELLKDVEESKFNGSVGIEDLIISGLITYCPKEIYIYGKENVKNKEMLDTIFNVFENKVSIKESKPLIKEENQIIAHKKNKEIDKKEPIHV